MVFQRFFQGTKKANFTRYRNKTFAFQTIKCYYFNILHTKYGTVVLSIKEEKKLRITILMEKTVSFRGNFNSTPLRNYSSTVKHRRHFFWNFKKKKLNERSTSQNSLAMANVRSDRNVTPQNKSGLFQFCMILTVFSKLRIKIKEFSQRGLKYNI